jgi:hypothetical protein
MGKKAAEEAVHGIKALVPMIGAHGAWGHVVNITARYMHSRCTKSRMVESVRSNFSGMRTELEGHKSKSWYGAGEIHILRSPAAVLMFRLPKPVKRPPRLPRGSRQAMLACDVFKKMVWA